MIELRSMHVLRAAVRGLILATVLVASAGNAHAATISVNTTVDGVIADSACGLREAILAANADAAVGGCVAGSGADTILVPAGRYTLTVAGTAENGSATGDLDLRSAMSIVGAGASTTIVDSAGIDRVFHVDNPTFNPSVIELTNLTITGGAARSGASEGYGRGGGVDVDPSGGSLTFTMTGCWVTGNTAEMAAGVFLGSSAGTIRSSSITANTATYVGGGLELFYGINLIDQVTISGNRAPFAGGAYVWYGRHTFDSSTISGNTVSNGSDANNGNSAGLFIGSETTFPTSSPPTTTLKNTILADNTGPSWFELNLACNRLSSKLQIISGGYNLIGTQASGYHRCAGLDATDLNGVSASLGALGDYGGGIPTVQLRPGSPAIGSGSCNRVDGSVLTVDARGFPRPNPVGSSCDRGALERGRCGDAVLEIYEACDDGGQNSDTNADACRTSCVMPTCGDSVVDTGETCDDGAANSDTNAGACRTTCVPARCGDGVTDPGEACDQGAANSDSAPDACRVDCSTPTCGDQVIDTGEACDDGAANSDTVPNACRSSCGAPTCGDGVVDDFETCDDGVANSDTAADACRTTCGPASCGDSVVDAGEACDDGAGNSDTSADACRTSCTNAGCGDSVVDTGEACDDGAGNSDTTSGACRSTCVAASCGDGVVDTGEACDDGANNSDATSDACRSICVAASCGDGVVDAGEACDDGASNSDTAAGACRSTCVAASCGDGVVDAGEACDDGGNNSDTATGACRSTCVAASCGDGVVDAGEVCDDGANNSDTASGACRSTCVVASCGDGVVDADEACDDGAGNSDTVAGACRVMCVAAHCGDGVVDDGEVCDDPRTTDCLTGCEGPVDGPDGPDGAGGASGCSCQVTRTSDPRGALIVAMAIGLGLSRRRRARRA